MHEHQLFPSFRFHIETRESFHIPSFIGIRIQLALFSVVYESSHRLKLLHLVSLQLGSPENKTLPIVTLPFNANLNSNLELPWDSMASIATRLPTISLYDLRLKKYNEFKINGSNIDHESRSILACLSSRIYKTTFLNTIHSFGQQIPEQPLRIYL